MSATDAAKVDRFSPEQVAQFLAKRDLSVDLVRVFCVMLVVVIHSLMVGIQTVPELKVVNPGQGEPWFKYATWFGQIMPLFFIVGGFASWQGWHSNVRKGKPTSEFFRARVLRLVYPALVWFLVMTALLWGATLLGAPRPLAEQVSEGLGMPLWFLAAYLITQFFVPTMVRLHERYRWYVPAALALIALTVDAARYASGITEIGLINMLFIWLAAQQLGFFYADGSLARLSRRSLVGIALLGFAAVALLGSMRDLLGLARGYSPDMLDNLNPPTLPLLFIGAAHLALFLLFKPALDTLMQKRAAQGAVLFLGARAMTIYLWHLFFVIVLNALVLFLPLPQPGTGAWWWARIPQILLTYGLIFAISLLVARFERGPKRIAPTILSPGLSVLVALLAIVPPFYAIAVPPRHGRPAVGLCFAPAGHPRQREAARGQPRCGSTDDLRCRSGFLASALDLPVDAHARHVPAGGCRHVGAAEEREDEADGSACSLNLLS